MTERVGLVGCVKSKGMEAAPAADLFTSTLFTGRRRYVERTCDRWYVLSAQHGLLEPTDVIEPYDASLKDLPESDRRRWASRVLDTLTNNLGDLSHFAFEVHAGSAYRDYGLVAGLRRARASVEIPAAGLNQGQQLAFYQRGDVRNPGRSGGAYDALCRHLSGNDEPVVDLTFTAIETILDRALPASARRHRPWWGNNDRSPQARSWLGAGFAVDAVDLGSGRVRFRRRGRVTPGSSPSEALAELPHVTELEPLTVSELLADYAAILRQLRQRGVVRSANAPAGDYAEWLVARALGGKLVDNFSVKSFDVVLDAAGQHEHVQVKARVVSDPPHRGQLQCSPFRSWDFDTAAFVMLRDTDYTVVRAVLVPVAAVESTARYVKHVNGYRVDMTPALLDGPAARDITEIVRSAAIET